MALVETKGEALLFGDFWLCRGLSHVSHTSVRERRVEIDSELATQLRFMNSAADSIILSFFWLVSCLRSIRAVAIVPSIDCGLIVQSSFFHCRDVQRRCAVGACRNTAPVTAPLAAATTPSRIAAIVSVSVLFRCVGLVI